MKHQNDSTHPLFTPYHNRLVDGQVINWVGLGDSLTYGWMVEQGFFDRFINLLKMRVLQGRVSPVNMGMPGATAQDGIARLPSLLKQAPDIITIQFGLNDLYQQVPITTFRQHISAMALQSIDAGVLPILVTSCPIIAPKDNEIATLYYNQIREAADELHIPCANLDLFWQSQAEPNQWQSLIQSDRLHPTDEGHALMAEGLLKTLIFGENGRYYL